MSGPDVERIAAKAEFAVSPYGDCGTPRVTVRYDTTPPSDISVDCRDKIWVETGYGTNLIAFDYTIADEVCAAIQSAARAVRAHLERKTNDTD